MRLSKRMQAGPSDSYFLSGWLGASVVDAGANIGTFTLFLSNLVGPTGRVHSFEPSPDNLWRLADVSMGPFECDNK